MVLLSPIDLQYNPIFNALQVACCLYLLLNTLNKININYFCYFQYFVGIIYYFYMLKIQVTDLRATSWSGSAATFIIHLFILQLITEIMQNKSNKFIGIFTTFYNLLFVLSAKGLFYLIRYFLNYLSKISLVMKKSIFILYRFLFLYP